MKYLYERVISGYTSANPRLRYLESSGRSSFSIAGEESQKNRNPLVRVRVDVLQLDVGGVLAIPTLCYVHHIDFTLWTSIPSEYNDHHSSVVKCLFPAALPHPRTSQRIVRSRIARRAMQNLPTPSELGRLAIPVLLYYFFRSPFIATTCEKH